MIACIRDAKLRPELCLSLSVFVRMNELSNVDIDLFASLILLRVSDTRHHVVGGMQLPHSESLFLVVRDYSICRACSSYMTGPSLEEADTH